MEYFIHNKCEVKRLRLNLKCEAVTVVRLLVPEEEDKRLLFTHKCASFQLKREHAQDQQGLNNSPAWRERANAPLC